LKRSIHFYKKILRNLRRCRPPQKHNYLYSTTSSGSMVGELTYEEEDPLAFVA